MHIADHPVFKDMPSVQDWFRKTEPTKLDRRHDHRRKVETPDPRATCGDALYKASSSTIDRICEGIKLS